MSGAEVLSNKLHEEILELAGSIKAIVDKYKQLRPPLLESHEKVPQATQQLDKISEQTEAATHQMLDLTEKITQEADEVGEGLSRIKELAESGQVGEIVSIIDAVSEKTAGIGNDAFTIMDALQFQDITSQQMNHAASLLEEIEIKLQEIIGVMQGRGGNSNGDSEHARKVRVYDPHADLFEKKTNQEDIDNLFNGNK